jgi:hypothetical protein
METKINWLAIAASVVGGMFIGFLWYGALFQNQWMAGNSITLEGEKMLKNGVEMSASATPMIVNAISMLAYALGMNWLLGRMGVRSWGDGAMSGAVIGFMVAFGVFVGNMFAMNPASLSMVDGSYSFVLFTLIGAIVGGWRKK